LFELVDQVDALLKAVLAPLVVLDFLDDRLELLRLQRALLDGGLFLIEGALREEPIAQGGQGSED
jgi:hypothetical protein